MSSYAIPPLPTVFAKAMAIGVDLYIPDDDRNIDEDDWEHRYNQLIEFQSMAIANDFDMCLTVYWNQELNDKQREALKLIHQTTKSWLLGFVVRKLLDKINSAWNDGKDISALAAMILENLGGKELNDKTAGKLIVEFANIPAGAVLQPQVEDEESEDEN